MLACYAEAPPIVPCFLNLLKNMNYFLLAGEASGDLHASNLMQQLVALDPEARFAGLGGDLMQAAGCHLYQNYRQMAFMGIAAVLRNLGNVKRNFRIAKEALLKEQPDALILIDYPSFNLKIAHFCKEHLPQTRIFYYIPPKVWAWKRFRIHRIAELSDAILGIFPFEPDFYRQFGYACTYVGNPTMDSVRAWAHSNTNVPTALPTIAILPGSRPSEISHCLPRMLEAAHRFSDYRIVVTAAPGIDDSYYASYLTKGEQLTRKTYDTVSQATAAIVNSGTATLETALLHCPQVAVYHVGCPRLFGLFWRTFFTMRLFTLPNIILGREAIREKLATHFTADEVADELDRLLHDEAYRRQMLADYDTIADILGPTPAAVNAARIIHKRLTSAD